MIREKEINTVLKAYKKLTKEEQAELRRKLLFDIVKSKVKKNWDKYPDEEISEEEVMNEVKAVRNARKKK